MTRLMTVLVALLVLAGLLGYALVRRAERGARPEVRSVPRTASRAPRSEPTPEAASPIRFRDVAAGAGVDLPPFHAALGRFRLVETMGSGLALIDADGDGWLDVVVGQGALLPEDKAPEPRPTTLYRNLGGGQFEDVTETAGLRFREFSQGMAVGDYDGDGRDDLFLAGFGRSALYRNLGDGRFADVTDSAGVAGYGWPSSCAFADLDGDGDLDLYVVHYLADTVDAFGRATVRCNAVEGRVGYCPPQAHRPEADVLYRNNGDGTFTDVSVEAGLASAPAPGLGLAIADLDGDGRLDVFIANDQAPNQAWRNLGGLRFEDRASDWGLALGETGETRAGMGVAAGDYDEDGRLDLLVTNFYEEPDTLFRQVAPGLFQPVSAEARLAVPSRTTLSFGTAFLDADSDGRLDLFVANGHINDVRPLGIPYAQPPQLFWNRGGGRFEEVTRASGEYFVGSYLARAAAVGDLDNDGDVDLIVNHLDRPPAVLLNETPRIGGTLTLRLRAATLSRSPIGARVRVGALGRTIHRDVVAGTSYLASHDPRLHVGLGAARTADWVEVDWPSGRRERWSELPESDAIELVEGTAPQAVSTQVNR
ncbi:MAG: hypothetical protein KatS3mg108_3405 [Isosphaeraceae bacterium]|jgi:hypothetical protein|nr:MAG: hypothetical protein KatS3mg108_3405 [Isosphaeraceae bacterium]